MRTYHVTMTKEGMDAGLSAVDEVHTEDNEVGPRVEHGALRFNVADEVIIYGPGMWAVVTGGYKSEG